MLDTFQNIKVCMEYKDNKPLYENYAGWETNISGIKTYEELPKNAKIYIFLRKRCRLHLRKSG